MSDADVQDLPLNHFRVSPANEWIGGAEPLMNFICTNSMQYDDSDSLSPFASFEHNTNVHASTNFTPLVLVYSRVDRFPVRIPRAEQLRTYKLYLQDLATRLNELKLVAGKSQIKVKIRSKEHYDRKSKPLKGTVGDYVWVLKEPRRTKFDRFYNKSLRIVEILSKNNVILELPNGKRIRKHGQTQTRSPLQFLSSLYCSTVPLCYLWLALLFSAFCGRVPSLASITR